jgi:hypothetical protein
MTSPSPKSKLSLPAILLSGFASTKIHHVNAKTGEFWLPEHNESDTDVRLGGRATLTIDYGAYKMDSPDPRTQQAALQSQTSALRK